MVSITTISVSTLVNAATIVAGMILVDVLVSSCVHIGIYVAVTAGAGMGGVALFRTGRLGYYGRIAVFAQRCTATIVA